MKANTMPERTLLLAVIYQAITDADTSYRQAREADEAWSFLTDRSGNWARSRDRICQAAGVDPDVLRQRVLKTIRPPFERRIEDELKRKGRRFPALASSTESATLTH